MNKKLKENRYAKKINFNKKDKEKCVSTDKYIPDDEKVPLKVNDPEDIPEDDPFQNPEQEPPAEGEGP